ncbi:MAG: hypothetical protein ACI4Q5_05685 [Porcipelethomonas sp.]
MAELIEQSHQDNTSILKYNGENSLACVISLAYYSAQKTIQLNVSYQPEKALQI